MDQTQKLNAPIRKHIFLIVAGILLLLADFSNDR